MQRANLIGQEFNWLTVEEFLGTSTFGKNTKRAMWKCRCKCGNCITASTNELRSGLTQSCGCKKKEVGKKRIINEVGKIYNNLLVKELLQTKSKDHRAQFLCECLLCGNNCIATGKDLRSGRTKSCGCLKVNNRKTFGERTFKDLTGQIIGYLLVEGRAQNKYSSAGNQTTMWNCKCLLCGGHTIVAGTALWGETPTRSCGCLRMSYNEKAINDELIKLKIEFYHDFSFSDLISPNSDNPLRFDFALFENGWLLGLIEYQGIQHYQKFKDGFGDFQREVTDPMKREYCKNNGIPLFEIKYDSDIIKELYKILSITYNTLYDNTVPSSKEEKV